MTTTLRVDNDAQTEVDQELCQLGVRIPVELRNTIKAVAGEWNVSMNELVTDILTNGIREYTEGRTVVQELRLACQTYLVRLANGNRRDKVRETSLALIRALCAEQAGDEE